MTLTHTPVPADSYAPPSRPAPGNTPTVIGIDSSMTSTGVASSRGWTQRVASAGSRGDDLNTRHQRLCGLVRDITTLVPANAALVVIEGPSYASSGAGTWDRAGLWWLIVDRLICRGIPVAVAPPTCRMRYATGTGRADKDVIVREVTRRFDWFAGKNDEADALILCALGADWLGHPIVDMPKTHRAALDGVAWPDLVPVVAA